MLSKMATFFEGFAKNLGLTIHIPRPSKAMRMVSAMMNSIAGVLLIMSGIILSSKVLVGLGMLGIAGAIVLVLDR